MTGVVRRILANALFAVAAVGTFAACSTVPIPPTYTQDELKAICERRGGWWHDDALMGGFCENNRSEPAFPTTDRPRLAGHGNLEPLPVAGEPDGGEEGARKPFA